MDNLFITVHTLLALLEIQTFAAGTTRANRGLPAELEKANKMVKNPGDFFVSQGPKGLLAVQWLDSGVVVGMSTAHDGLPAVVERRERGRPGRVQRPCPDIFSDYNKFMGGVDLADLRRSWHSCRLRAFKWWHPLFYWIVDSAMINAHIFRNVQAGHSMPGSLFWLRVVEGLVQKKLRGDVDADSAEIEEYAGAPRRASNQELGEARLHGRHWVVKAPTCGRCRLCTHIFERNTTAYNRKTNMYCEQCELHLHVECFKAFHTKAFPLSQYS
jgi:hypothetical protein